MGNVQRLDTIISRHLEVAGLSCPNIWMTAFLFTHGTLSMEMSRTDSRCKQLFICSSVLGKNSTADVQSLCLTSNFLHLFVLDSRRPCQREDPLLLWTPSRFHKYCSRSSHLLCFLVCRIDTKSTCANASICIHSLSHTFKTSKFALWLLKNLTLIKRQKPTFSARLYRLVWAISGFLTGVC